MRMRTTIALVMALMPVLVAAAADLGCGDLDASLHMIYTSDPYWDVNPNFWDQNQIEVDGDFVYFSSGGNLVGVMDVGDPRHPRVLPNAMWVEEGLYALTFDYEASFVYMGTEVGIEIFDASQPTSPHPVSKLALPSSVESIVVAGTRAYVSRYDETINGPVIDVVDVADPAAPHVVRTVAGLFGRSAKVQGSRLYLLDGNLQIADISDPDLPTLVGAFDVEALGYIGGRDFALSGNHLYMAASPAKLLVLDVADAANPTLVGTWSAGSEWPASAESVAIMGSYAIVGGDEALHIVDISDPTAPVGVSRFLSLDRNKHIVVANGLIYVARWSWELGIIEPGNFRAVTAHGFKGTDEAVTDVSPSPDPELCLALTGTQLRVLDHANPEAPEFVASLDLPGQPRRLVLMGNRAYVACDTSGVVVVDVANPRAPAIVGAVPGVTSAIDLKAVGTMLHVVGDQGPYWAVETAGTGLPVLVGMLSVGVDAMDIGADGTNVYVGSWTQVQAIDVSNPATPVSRFVQDKYMYGEPPDIVARAGLVHVLTRGDMRTLEDVGDSLREVSVTAGTGPDLAFDGDVAYTPDYGWGARAFDFADPREPAYLGTIESTDWWSSDPRCVTVSGDHVIIGYEYGGLLVAPRVCGPASSVADASFVAFRDGDGVRLRWVVPGAASSTMFRVVVQAAGGDRVVSGAALGGGMFEALDALAARATAPLTYVLECRAGGGAWLAISTTTYAPAAVVSATRLTGCAPNPFNPNTRVAFTLAAAGRVVVAVHDAAGRQVAVLADAAFGAGPHVLTWNGRDGMGREMASGIYLVSLRTDAGVDTRKVVLVR